ncbi:MAG: response regulator [Solirubrobacteraceae bacterium]|nr:response regulator [Solirubrobacteraceae bacterium]
MSAPTASRHDSLAATDTAAHEQRARDRLTVGVIEDSDEDFAIFARVFRRMASDAEVKRWTRAEAALAQLTEDEEAPRPDVLVVDLSLPGIDGCELVRRLRKHPETSGVPMFMLSGSDRQMDIERCLEAGATGYFSKSPRSADLQAVLDQILSAAQSDEGEAPGTGGVVAPGR